jgi:hypothetical protein
VAQGLGADHAERSPDVESAPSHHCRHCREAPGQRGCPQLRGCPVLGLHPACPVPGRRGRRVRAAVPPPEDPGFDNQIFADMLASIERLSDEDCQCKPGAPQNCAPISGTGPPNSLCTDQRSCHDPCRAPSASPRAVWRASRRSRTRSRLPAQAGTAIGKAARQAV